jgi:hypothetical protein
MRDLREPKRSANWRTDPVQLLASVVYDNVASGTHHQARREGGNASGRSDQVTANLVLAEGIFFIVYFVMSVDAEDSRGPDILRQIGSAAPPLQTHVPPV